MRGVEEELLEDFCELATRAANALGAVITKYSAATNSIAILAQFGTFTTYEPKEKWPGLEAKCLPLLVVPDVQNDPLFEGHPLRQAIPTVRSLVAAILCQQDSDRVVLSVFNPDASFFSNPVSFACFLKLTKLFSKFLQHAQNHDGYQEIASTQVSPLSEALSVGSPGGFEDETAAASTFLFETLPKKKTLRTRKNASYVTLRSWNRSIKKYQIAALTAIKAAPPRKFVENVAHEIADAVESLYGREAINAVVSVPPGSSGKSTGLSNLLGIEVAALIGRKYVSALENTSSETGKSHPRKSARLRPYRVKEAVSGVVLLVDDVVSSGRHLELAHDALRKTGASMTLALAWIGN